MKICINPIAFQLSHPSFPSFLGRRGNYCLKPFLKFLLPERRSGFVCQKADEDEVVEQIVDEN